MGTATNLLLEKMDSIVRQNDARHQECITEISRQREHLEKNS